VSSNIKSAKAYPSRVPVTPPLRHWKPKDKAVVYTGGKRIYLGTWGTQEAADAYSRFVAAWTNKPGVPRPRLFVGTITQLADAYVGWAKSHFVKGQRVTTSASKAVMVAELLYRSGAGRTAVADFGPVALGEFQQWLAGDKDQTWARRTINEYVRIVVEMFRWGVSQELVDEGRHRALQTLRGLAKGRPPAKGVRPPREGRIVTPAPRESVRAVRRLVSPAVRAMIDLQLLTGMRPAEVCAMKPCHVRPTSNPKVLVYLVPPDRNKTEHFDITRQVWLGPRSVRVLKLFQPPTQGEGYFSPRRAEEARNAAKRATRRNPRWASHSTAARRISRGASEARWSDMYTVDSYRRAITRACEAAGVETFAPNQLRHSAATGISLRNDLEVAQLMLGHADARTTQRYARAATRLKAQRSAARLA